MIKFTLNFRNIKKLTTQQEFAHKNTKKKLFKKDTFLGKNPNEVVVVCPVQKVPAK